MFLNEDFWVIRPTRNGFTCQLGSNTVPVMSQFIVSRTFLPPFLTTGLRKVLNNHLQTLDLLATGFVCWRPIIFFSLSITQSCSPNAQHLLKSVTNTPKRKMSSTMGVMLGISISTMLHFLAFSTALVLMCKLSLPQRSEIVRRCCYISPTWLDIYSHAW